MLLLLLLFISLLSGQIHGCMSKSKSTEYSTTWNGLLCCDPYVHYYCCCIGTDGGVHHSNLPHGIVVVNTKRSTELVKNLNITDCFGCLFGMACVNLMRD